MVIERNRIGKTSTELTDILKKAKLEGKLEETILEYFSNYEMDMVIIWNCREYLCALSDEYYQKYPFLLSYRIIIEAMRGNITKTEILIKGMGRKFDENNIKDFTALDYTRLMLEMVLPQLSNEEFVRRARFLVSISKDSVKGLALNACRPSIINGFRDFTEFCVNMVNSRDEIEKTIEVLYGNDGKGIYDVAMAEWNYELGDIFKALIGVAGTIPRLDDAKDIRCLFVAYVLQMKILLINGQMKDSKELFEKIRARIYENNYEELVASLNAFECMQNCYEGNNEKVEEWLNTEAPSENGEIFMMGIYSYFIKMRCYLQLGNYMLTTIIGKRLLEMLKISQRPHDKCECHMLLAMASFIAGDEETSVYEMDCALKIADTYNYVRLFADEGQIMINLIKLYKSKSAYQKYEERLKTIKTMAMEVAGRFPDYISSKNENITLTETEKKVLQLMAEGLSNESIGQRLKKKEGSIKFHASNIYRKFNVSNRQQAINYARNSGMI